MTEENCDSETIPGITVPLDKIVATTINTDNHGFPVKRCSSRKRSLPDFFVPTHSRPSKRLHDGPGRPRKKSLCESPASQPSQRVPSRLRKQRSDETDVEVPTTETTQIPSSQHLRHGPGRPRKQRLDVREMKGETVLSPEVTEAPVVSPPPAAPLGSTGDCLLQVSAPTSSPEAVAPTLLWSTSDVEVSPMAATQSPASQPLRRGPGPPGKQQSDGESPASQPFRHVSSRPRKRRSDEIDVEVPTTETTQIPSSQHLRRGRGRPRKQRLDVHEMKGETVVSPEVTEAPAVSPPPAAPLGSTRDCLLQVSAPKSSPEAVAPTLLWSTSDVEVLPMAATQSPASQPLRHGPDPAGKQQSDGDETLKVHGIIPGTMLLPEEKEETMSSLSALQKNYENAILSLNDVEEDLGRTPGELEKAKEKKETLKRQIEDLKQEVAGIEHEEEHLKHEEIKYKEARDVAKAKMQELGTKLEAAQAKLREIEQRKKAALRGIESTTRYLQSTFLDNLD